MDVQTFLHAPIVTTTLLVLNVAFFALVTMEIVHPLQLAVNPALIREQKQYWRVVTCFFFHGKLNFDTVFMLGWMQTMSRGIEEQYFFRRPLDYAFVLVLGAAMSVGCRFSGVIDTPFLGTMLTTILLYLFSRLNPNQMVNVMALFEMRLRVLPLVTLGISYALNGVSIVKPSILAMFIGHILWYFLEVFPRITGIQLLKIQRRLEHLIQWNPVQLNVVQ